MSPARQEGRALRDILCIDYPRFLLFIWKDFPRLRDSGRSWARLWRSPWQDWASPGTRTAWPAPATTATPSATTAAPSTAATTPHTLNIQLMDTGNSSTTQSKTGGSEGWARYLYFFTFRVSKCSSSNVISNEAYLLFFELSWRLYLSWALTWIFTVQCFFQITSDVFVENFIVSYWKIRGEKINFWSRPYIKGLLTYQWKFKMQS